MYITYDSYEFVRSFGVMCFILLFKKKKKQKIKLEFPTWKYTYIRISSRFVHTMMFLPMFSECNQCTILCCNSICTFAPFDVCQNYSSYNWSSTLYPIEPKRMKKNEVKSPEIHALCPCISKITFGMFSEARITILVWPPTSHFTALQFGSQEWLTNRASFPWKDASMNSSEFTLKK